MYNNEGTATCFSPHSTPRVYRSFSSRFLESSNPVPGINVLNDTDSIFTRLSLC